MAPRKDASDAQQTAGIDSFELPKALVTRLAKSVLPPDAKLQKDTVAALVRGATVFINYLSATAQDIATSRSRRTIMSVDVLTALEVLALGDLVPLLQRELEGYRGQKENKNKNTKGKGKEVASDEPAASAREQEEESEEEGEEGVLEENEDEPEPDVPPDEWVEEDNAPGEGEERPDKDVLSEAEMPVIDHPSNGVEDEENEIEDVVALETGELHRDALELEGRRDVNES